MNQIGSAGGVQPSPGITRIVRTEDAIESSGDQHIRVGRRLGQRMQGFVLQFRALVPLPPAVGRLEKPTGFIVSMGSHVKGS